MYAVKRSLERRQMRSSDEAMALHEPLQLLSTSDSCGALSSSALAASLGDLDARDGLAKPSLIL